LLLHVDDIPANVNAEEAARLKQRLMEQFGTVQFTVSGRLSYLGMQIDITRDGTIIDVSFYVKHTLEGVDWPVRASPGTKPTFVVEEGAQKMCEEERKVFHSTVTKLLVLAKHARPDILTIVSFLCMQV
jgi:hypothetical protein